MQYKLKISAAKYFLAFIMSSVALWLIYSATAYAADGSYNVAVKKAKPSVVNIFTTREVKKRQIPFDHPILRYYFGDRAGGAPREEVKKATSLGSGVIINSKGYVVTNNHVIEGAQDIDVGLADGRQAEAKVVGRDSATDLAVLKISLPGLVPITRANSANLEVGDVVLAIGNPYGLGQTVTQGIVSALGRNALGINQLENFIQTDAAINPGNSGGALVNASGKLVGINSAIFSRSGGNHGIGFAIPSNLVDDVFKQLVKHGKISRGWLGVKIITLNSQLKKQLELTKTNKGVVIVGVGLGSPANKAGLMIGDVVIKANKVSIKDVSTFISVVAKTKPEQTIKMIIIRQNKKKTIKVTVGDRPKNIRPIADKD